MEKMEGTAKMNPAQPTRSPRKGAKVAPVRITQRTRSQLQPDWPFCLGIGGRIKSESVAALPRNAQIAWAVSEGVGFESTVCFAYRFVFSQCFQHFRL